MIAGGEINAELLIHTQRGGTAPAGSSKEPGAASLGEGDSSVTWGLAGRCEGCTKGKIHAQGRAGSAGLIPLFLEGKQTRLGTVKSPDVQMCALFGAWHWEQRQGSKQPRCPTAPGKAPLFPSRVFLAANKQLMCPVSLGHPFCCLRGGEELFLEKAAQHERQNQAGLIT